MIINTILLTSLLLLPQSVFAKKPIILAASLNTFFEKKTNTNAKAQAVNPIKDTKIDCYVIYRVKQMLDIKKKLTPVDPGSDYLHKSTLDFKLNKNQTPEVLAITDIFYTALIDKKEKTYTLTQIFGPTYEVGLVTKGDLADKPMGVIKNIAVLSNAVSTLECKF